MVLYAEDLNYWKSSQTMPDTWIEKAKREIVGAGGEVLAEAFAYEPTSGRQAYMIQFVLAGDAYKITWPVLESKTKNIKAARIQATTMLYHDVKARCVSAKVLGARAAFMTFLMLPDGRTVSEVTTDEIVELAPAMLAPPVDVQQVIMLPSETGR